MRVRVPFEIDADIEDLLTCLRNPETNAIVIRIEASEVVLAHGEHEREAIWSAKDLRGGLTADAWRMLCAAASFDQPFTSAEIARRMGLADAGEITHKMRALGRTAAYKKVKHDHREDVPIRPFRVAGEKRYQMRPWWRNAIQSIDPSVDEFTAAASPRPAPPSTDL